MVNNLTGKKDKVEISYWFSNILMSYVKVALETKQVNITILLRIFLGSRKNSINISATEITAIKQTQYT